MVIRKRDQSPPKHPDKDVRKVVAAAFAAGWLVEYPMGHPWGRLCCDGASAAEECRIIVYSTPRGNQVRILERELAKCPHGRAVGKK